MKPNLFNLPFDEFRSDGVNQKDAIIKLIQTETPIVSLIAPPGSGKTMIALAYGEVQGRTLFLTPTKHLHAQLEEYGVFSLHGHSHYSCWKNGECVQPNDCEYAAKMKLARTKRRVGTTYANWIGLNRRGMNSLGVFDLVVCDEAHNLPWIIADQMTFSLGKEWCEDFQLVGDELSSSRKFLRTLLPKFTDKDTVKERNAIEMFLSDSTINQSWLCEINNQGLTCRVIWSNSFSRHVFIDCKKVLLMSATLSYQTLKYLNIDLADNTFIELETNFDPNMNPFIAVPVVAVQYNMSSQDCDKLVDFVDNVIESRLNLQGVIHSVSYEYARMVLGRSKYASKMISHKTGTISQAIEMFMSKEYQVLISPSLSEGVSLSGDHCRWQIPIKIPTQNKIDSLTAIRCAQDRDYEPFLMANTIQQQHGRGRRDINDWCESLMPDSHWEKFYRRNKRFFMKWFQATVRKVNTLPLPLGLKRKL